MESFKYLIIGGGVAGTTAAETIRKEDPIGTIAIVSDEPYRFYSRIMLSKPNFFLGKIPFDTIWLKQESWYVEHSINLILGKVASDIKPSDHIVRLNDGTEIKYEKLLLATGGCARKLSTKGADKKGICVLRNLDEAKEIIERTKIAKNAIVIGGGFIGFEMCDMLKMAGVDVTLLIREPYFWQVLWDETSGKLVEKALEDGGVKILRNSEVEEFLGNDVVESVKLKDGSFLPANLVIVGVGLACMLDSLKSAGIEVGRGILANEYLETNQPDIWTAGDVAEFQDVVLKERIQLGNWTNALMQGKVAGLNMVGKKEEFRLVSFYTTNGFGINIAFVGDARVDASKKVVTRGSYEDNSYSRLIFSGNRLVGATLINKTQEMGTISKLIEKGFVLDGFEEKLADSNFDLKTLI